MVVLAVARNPMMRHARPPVNKHVKPRAVPAPVGPRVVDTAKAQKKSQEKSADGDPAKVVSIDAFRKK